MEELGAGFFLAMHDLEIRGTGEVLGESQSGNIHEIGISMYSDMLNAAVRALKSGEEPDLDSPFSALCEVNLHRSEEHTSELQSLMRRSYAVFCLKKKIKIPDTKSMIVSCT